MDVPSQAPPAAPEGWQTGGPVRSASRAPLSGQPEVGPGWRRGSFIPTRLGHLFGTDWERHWGQGWAQRKRWGQGEKSRGGGTFGSPCWGRGGSGAGDQFLSLASLSVSVSPSLCLFCLCSDPQLHLPGIRRPSPWFLSPDPALRRRGRASCPSRSAWRSETSRGRSSTSGCGGGEGGARGRGGVGGGGPGAW